MRRTTLAWLAAGAAIALALGACSGSTNGGKTTGTGGAGGGNGGSGAGGDLFGGGGPCSPGDSCDGGGICTDDGTCCPEAAFCGGDCCEGAEVCFFQSCSVPGNDCIDATDCGPDEYCEYGLGDPPMGMGGMGGMCSGSVELPTGKCLPKPPECGPNQDPGDPPTCIDKCEYKPPVGQFTPEQKFSWGVVGDSSHNVMMAPIVTQLDDDNCDGSVSARDVPDIVFFTFTGGDYNNTGNTSATLRAISIVNGVLEEKWSTATAGDHPGRSIAAGDLVPAPGNEIVVCTRNADEAVRAYTADGDVLWTSPAMGTFCFMPSIADLDQDGTPEVITRQAIFNGTDGSVKHTYTPANSENVVVSDVTGDGQLDVVASSRVYDASGALIVASGVLGTHPAVGDLDKDGIPEIVTVDFQNHALSVWHVDPNAPGGFAIIRQGVDINGTISPNPCCAVSVNSAGCLHGGGPPTIADFNGDGFPDVGLAGGIGYAMFDGVKLMDPVTYTGPETIAWIKPTQDCSSAQTGSSVFDFDGDGKAEVVYADEVTLHIYDGTTGDDLFGTCNTSGTLYEYPLVADVDGDGHADIVVASNHYSGLVCAGNAKTTGIRVFGDNAGNWVRTRNIWNQHAYHVTNVNDDGSIPQVEATNWLDPSLNNFRQNVQPLGEFSAPDLVVDVFPVCTGAYRIVGRVRNIGQASVPAGVVVGFYEGDPQAGGTLLGQAQTLKTLYALDSEDVTITPAGTPTGSLYAVVDDGMPAHPWHECRTDNNIGGPADPDCGPQ